MQWEIWRYGHIPGIKLEPDQRVELGPGELRSVPFDEWSTFVGRHVERSERHYTKTRPAFYVDRVVVDDAAGVDQESDLFEPFSEQLTRLHTALVHTLRAALPDPLQSTRYLLSKASKQRFRDLGQRDIEWMVYGAWEHGVPVPVDREGPLGQMLGRLHDLSYGAATPELRRVLDVVKMAAEPPLEPMDVVMHAVIALEDVLNPGADRPLGRTFARRGAAVCAARHDELEDLERMFVTLYQVRSKSLHGEDPSVALGNLERWCPDPLSCVFFVCGQVGQSLGQYIDRWGPNDAVANLLRDADGAVNPQGHQRLHDGLQPEWFYR